MNPVSVDIKDMLEAASLLALEFQDNLFIGFEPANPDDCVTIYDTGGEGLSLTFDREERYYYSTFQIRIRNSSYLVGLNLATLLMETLHGRGHETWSEARYSLIRCVSGPAFIGRDENARMIFVINFETQRREA